MESLAENLVYWQNQADALKQAASISVQKESESPKKETAAHSETDATGQKNATSHIAEDEAPQHVASPDTQHMTQTHSKQSVQDETQQHEQSAGASQAAQSASASSHLTQTQADIKHNDGGVINQGTCHVEGNSATGTLAGDDDGTRGQDHGDSKNEAKVNNHGLDVKDHCDSKDAIPGGHENDPT